MMEAVKSGRWQKQWMNKNHWKYWQIKRIYSPVSQEERRTEGNRKAKFPRVMMGMMTIQRHFEHLCKTTELPDPFHFFCFLLGWSLFCSPLFEIVKFMFSKARLQRRAGVKGGDTLTKFLTQPLSHSFKPICQRLQKNRSVCDLDTPSPSRIDKKRPLLLVVVFACFC